MSLSQQSFLTATQQQQQQQQVQQPEVSKDRVGTEGYVPKGTSRSDLERLLGASNQRLG